MLSEGGVDIPQLRVDLHLSIQQLRLGNQHEAIGQPRRGGGTVLLDRMPEQERVA